VFLWGQTRPILRGRAHQRLKILGTPTDTHPYGYSDQIWHDNTCAPVEEWRVSMGQTRPILGERGPSADEIFGTTY